MVFEKVLGLLKKGFQIKRESWTASKGKLMLVKITDMNGKSLKGMEPELAAVKDGDLEGYTLTNEDIFAEDWLVVIDGE